MADVPPSHEVTDPAALRLLAHPLRHRIVELMRRGPVSCTTLARALGESTGSTSYHLRQMAKHGFVEEVPELARGRERWWRFVPGDRRFPQYSRQTPEMRSALEEVARLDFADDLDKLARFELRRAELGQWADALLWSLSSVRLTFDELKEFFEDYIRLLYRYKRSDDDGRADDSDVRDIRVRLLVFPEPEPPPRENDRENHHENDDAGGGEGE